MVFQMTAIRWCSSALLFLFTLVTTQIIFAAGSEIPQAQIPRAQITQASDLAKIARSSQRQGVPTIVFVSRDACPYCRTLRDSILVPMLAANKFEQRANLVEVSLDRLEPLTGFDGEMISVQAFSDRYRTGITPTLLFLDIDGREISKRRVGISNQELYSHYLQKSIDEALAVTRPQAQ